MPVGVIDNVCPGYESIYEHLYQVGEGGEENQPPGDLDQIQNRVKRGWRIREVGKEKIKEKQNEPNEEETDFKDNNEERLKSKMFSLERLLTLTLVPSSFFLKDRVKCVD